MSATGYAKSYGATRLIVKIGDSFYQAGDDVEGNITLLKPNCILKIEKMQIKRSTRSKHVICSVYPANDWTAHVEYSKTPILGRFDGSPCVVDVKAIDVKGVKRKLLLTQDGSVYKLKRS